MALQGCILSLGDREDDTGDCELKTIIQRASRRAEQYLQRDAMWWLPTSR